MKHSLTLLLLVTSTVLLHATEPPEAINGYQLPPEPDPVLNNSILLGIDANENDVRNDVEQWIYMECKDKHPVFIIDLSTHWVIKNYYMNFIEIYATLERGGVLCK